MDQLHGITVSTAFLMVTRTILKLKEQKMRRGSYWDTRDLPQVFASLAARILKASKIC